MEQALVVNCSRNGLGVIRSLGENGVFIIAVDHDHTQPGLYSKYTNVQHIVPRLTDEEGFIEGIIAIGKDRVTEGKCYLIPVNDIYVSAFCKHWHRLEEYFIPVFETNEDILHGNINKLKMYTVAEKAGVDYAKSVYDYRNLNKLQLPVVIKPDQKRADDNEKSVFRIAICDDALTVQSKCEELEKVDVPYVIQEFIEGGDDTLYTAGIWANKGTLRAICTCRKLRQFPPAIGQCSYGELVDAPEMIGIAKSFVAESKITGICQVEFKKRGDKYYLMEINPRSWSWNSITTYAGVNLPWIALKDLAGQYSDDFLQTQSKTKGKWMFAEQDIYQNILRNRNINPLKWIVQFLLANERAHFKLSDPKPYIMWLYTTIKGRI